MADTKKVTVTLTVDQVAQIQAMTRSGRAASVSGFVQHAVELALADEGGWAVALSEMLAASGGDLTDAEREWADGILRREP
ncbi:MAG: hypothetical protein ACT4QF_09895 [Sporichthyaceae bacterium]